MGFSAPAAPSSHDVKSSNSSNNNNNNHEQSMAQYLVDMSDANETLDFCGGMVRVDVHDMYTQNGAVVYLCDRLSILWSVFVCLLKYC